MIVKNVISKTKALAVDYPDLLEDSEEVLSHNKVCGYSLNVPIYRTCTPSKTCVKTCYFAKGGTSWTPSLLKQLRIYNTIKHDPEVFADRVIREYDKNKMTFLRWNGGGDLFPAAVDCINYIGEKRPDIVLWVVTRKINDAKNIRQFPNVYIHFSLDRSTTDKYFKYEQETKLSDNYFYSFQNDKGKEADLAFLERYASVVFYDKYKPIVKPDENEIVCPLNLNADITDCCEKCRRCFSGDAVKHRVVQQDKAAVK